LGQKRKDGYAETKIVTLGQDLGGANLLIEQHPEGWSAKDAVDWLISQVPASAGTSTDSAEALSVA
ncbi:MAG: hypothetical protein WBG89_04315, partial [Ornithinimicrobium sp.]